MWRAVFQSRNFSFEAYGTDEATAREALLEGLKIHTEQYGCDPDWWEPEDIFAYRVESGYSFRDHEPLRRAHENQV